MDLFIEFEEMEKYINFMNCAFEDYSEEKIDKERAKFLISSCDLLERIKTEIKEALKYLAGTEYHPYLNYDIAIIFELNELYSDDKEFQKRKTDHDYGDDKTYTKKQIFKRKFYEYFVIKEFTDKYNKIYELFEVLRDRDIFDYYLNNLKYDYKNEELNREIIRLKRAPIEGKISWIDLPNHTIIQLKDKEIISIMDLLKNLINGELYQIGLRKPMLDRIEDRVKEYSFIYNDKRNKMICEEGKWKLSPEL
jgi:hypothetical protein